MNIRQQLDSTNSAFRVQLWCLLAAGILEYLFIVGYSFFNWLFYYCNTTFLMIPAALFLGTALTRQLSAQAKRQLLLGAGVVLWFMFLQALRQASGSATLAVPPFFCVYLMSLPFAAVTGDSESQKGLKGIAWIFIAASMTMTAYAALLKLNLLPDALAPYVAFDGARLVVIFHSNVCAALFLVGIGLCLGFFFRVEKSWQKLLLLLAIAAQFACQALTHTRTSIILTCCLVGGAAFFAIWKKNGWKRFAAGIAVALVLTAALFLASSTLFKAHNAQMIAQLSQQSQESVSDSGSASTAYLNEAGELQGSSPQRPLNADIGSFNGRTAIWSAALHAMRDDPSILFLGTGSVGPKLTYYMGYYMGNCHNTWLETLMEMGLPGLAAFLIVTVVALWNAFFLLFRSNDMWKICVALLVLCLLAVGFLEIFLSCEVTQIHFFDFIMFLLIGYMTQWRKGASAAQTAER